MQYGFINVLYTQTDTSGAALDWGRCLISTIALWLGHIAATCTSARRGLLLVMWCGLSVCVLVLETLVNFAK